MPYVRPTAPPTPQQIVPVFEKAIKSLVRRFRNHPYVFYTETDMHCYLYHRLYEGGILNGLYTTAEGHATILLHKEYPTVSRYQRNTDRTLTESPQGRRRGAYDICIWDPQTIGAHEHRRQKILCAAELALNECGPGSKHTINDATKLSGTTNEIKYGYLLFFVRDDARFKINEVAIRSDLDHAVQQGVRVVLARVDGEKPTPEYLGDWGKI